MKTLLGMQYGGNLPQQYPRQQLQPSPKPPGGQFPRQYQGGGDVPSAYKTSFGLASLRRYKLKQEAYEAAQEEAARAGKRQKRSRLGGAFGGFTGGLLAAVLAPFTGGMSALPLMVGAGAGLGKLFGSKVGYEGGWEPGMMFRRTETPEMQDVLYGKEAGMDEIRDAGWRFRMGMSEDAIMSGLKAGLMTGFAPGGGMHGKVAEWSKGLKAPYQDVITAETGAIFNEATGMYGDVPFDKDIMPELLKSQGSPAAGRGYLDDPRYYLDEGYKSKMGQRIRQ